MLQYKKRCHEAESIDVAATCKKVIRENMKRYCRAENNDAAAAQRSNNNTSKKKNGMVGSIMLAQFATMRKGQMQSNVQ